MNTMNAEERLNKMLLDAKNRVYKQRAENPDKYKDYQRLLMKERRAKNKVEENKKNAEYQKKYRANVKEETNKVKALTTLSNAIVNRKARKEVEKLKDEKATKDLLNNVVKDAITQATTATTKKGRPAGSKNKVVEEKVYNLRSRNK